MWAIIGMLTTGVVISLFEIPPLVKKRWWREIIAYFLLLSIGMTFAVLLCLKINIPTPLNWIEKIYSPVTSFVERILS